MMTVDLYYAHSGLTESNLDMFTLLYHVIRCDVTEIRFRMDGNLVKTFVLKG